MSRLEKTIERLLNIAAPFSFKELVFLLSKLSYVEKKTGKTSGSRKAFVHLKTKHIIRIHKPHPGNELRRYQRIFIIHELQKQNLI